MTLHIIVTQKDLAGTRGNGKQCRDGWGWIQMSVGMGRHGCGTGGNGTEIHLRADLYNNSNTNRPICDEVIASNLDVYPFIS